MNPFSLLDSSDKNNIEAIIEYIDRCWDSYLHYKKDQDKIMFFGGTLFISIIAATGIVGAYVAKDTLIKFTFFHTILFHTIFFILFLFYLHKVMTASIFLQTAKKAEAYLFKKIGIDPQNKIIGFAELKSRYLGSSNKLIGKTNLATWANILCLILYISVSLIPHFINWNITNGLNWPSILTFAIFMAGYFRVIYLNKRKSNKINNQIIKDWEALLKN